ncbi:conserved hypothetical protein [Desulfofarcimen acetoxidans DSM 771]|jgi:hypothetical protein|uniref:Collagen triple helix repeat protein n=1 Tax=Desulfofarcimen acetoxidans (strain ATCC 49208 / DSM 771 / KCTC 5769 / VKM B-1644 / 5575) TaxID=485916 RepID=C8W6B5_DESAS|nr:hypothetical protein [Desulfofarcimen acetoxidans]ACV62204.1 conserved hypothetical protein [Desulfofarcimen acetoxidans DSM 771]
MEKSQDNILKVLGLNETHANTGDFVTGESGKPVPKDPESNNAAYRIHLVTIKDVDSYKWLMGINDEHYESGRMEDPHAYPVPWPARKNSIFLGELGTKDKQDLQQAFKNYVYGNSQKTQSYRDLINRAYFPMEMSVAVGGSITVTKVKPLIINENVPVFLSYDQITFEPGGYIANYSNTTIKAENTVVQGSGPDAWGGVVNVGGAGGSGGKGGDGGNGDPGSKGQEGESNKGGCSRKAGQGGTGITGGNGVKGGDGNDGGPSKETHFEVTSKLVGIYYVASIGGPGGNGGKGGNGGDGGEGGSGGDGCGGPGPQGQGGKGGDGGDGGSGGNGGNGGDIYVTYTEKAPDADIRIGIAPDEYKDYGKGGSAGDGGNAGNGGPGNPKGGGGQPGNSGNAGKGGASGKIYINGQ